DWLISMVGFIFRLMFRSWLLIPQFAVRLASSYHRSRVVWSCQTRPNNMKHIEVRTRSVGMTPLLWLRRESRVSEFWRLWFGRDACVAGGSKRLRHRIHSPVRTAFW